MYVIDKRQWVRHVLKMWGSPGTHARVASLRLFVCLVYRVVVLFRSSETEIISMEHLQWMVQQPKKSLFQYFFQIFEQNVE